MATGAPIGRNVHHDAPLANVAVKAFAGAEGYIASKVMPIVPVQKQSDRFYIVDKDSWIRINTSYRAPKTAPRRVNFRVSSDNYFADNYALAGENSFEDLANADDAIRLRENTTQMVTDMILRDYEDRVASTVTSGTNLGSYVTLANTLLWSDYTNSVPLSDVSTAHAFIRNRTGLVANTAIMDPDTISIIRKHPDLLDLYKYTSGGQVSLPQLADAFDVEQILIGKGIKNTNLVGGTASITNMWGNNAIFAHIKPGMSLETATYGLSFRWTPAGLPLPMQAYRYNDPDPGKKVEVVEVGMYQDEKIVGQDLSYGIFTTI
tara:strand:+ start:6713 stop:7672 length:960 start_codon:yes stop_codon:yes gene_type:complete